MSVIPTTRPSGEHLGAILTALAHPQRQRIIGALTARRSHVSELARILMLGRPLVHMHLQRLEAAGLVKGSLELAADGKAMKFFDVIPFSYCLTPQLIADAAKTLSPSQTNTRRTG
jgi:predicted transcriptional regulator